jgi:hypothetical protein
MVEASPSMLSAWDSCDYQTQEIQETNKQTNKPINIWNKKTTVSYFRQQNNDVCIFLWHEPAIGYVAWQIYRPGCESEEAKHQRKAQADGTCRTSTFFGFLMGVPPSHPCFRISINHPFLGTRWYTHLWKPPHGMESTANNNEKWAMECR